ncbi:SH3 domain-binding protein 5-like isoform X1 [Haliotis rufescens]|uniref:SH3 domain-binding protein 5-like isoform X1 n=1 Tax=Haliotis rufescens TaxID=6454 RepID=UPI00201EAF25|nr:SH3 domain-binding protein 5-like isoform X1 [Haliotis rufescens]
MDDTIDDVDVNDDLDPRIQEELDMLNSASNDINRLENEIDEARAKYRLTFSDASHKMESMGRGLKNFIQRARIYYQLKEAAIEAQSEALRAARQYQTANGIYRAAKETIALAEQKLMDDQSAAMLSSAWQEMLNHATIRVMDAEREKTRSEQEHLRRSNIFAELETKLTYLEKKFKKSILKARPYFELKAQLELKLQQQKQNIDDLQNAIRSSKVKYSDSLRHLEGISEEIHESRRQKILLMFPREPGVGADDESLGSSISEQNIERGLFSASSRTDDHLDSEIDEIDDVFTSDHVTDHAPNASSTDINYPKNLPGTKHLINSHVTSKSPDTKGDNRPDVLHNVHVDDISASFKQCDMINDNSCAGGRSCPASGVVNGVGNDHNHPDTPSGIRQCGSGAEISPVCVDDVTTCSTDVIEKVNDVILPERDDHTEGSSDPEECVKDLKLSRDNRTESTDVL